MNLINLTPHAITVMAGDGVPGMKYGPQPVITIHPSGIVARLDVGRSQIGTVTSMGHTIPINRAKFGDVTDLPEPEPDTYYIVSALVANALTDRNDLLMVDDAVRDDTGRIIGCRAFARP